MPYLRLIAAFWPIFSGMALDITAASQRVDSLNDYWAEDSSEISGPRSAKVNPLVQISGVHGTAAVQAHGDLWFYSNVVNHILVLLVSAFLMLLMLACLPESRI
jgi:hypothetical protein